MAKLQKFIEQTNWLWYTAELTDEQTAEYKAYLDALEKDIKSQLQIIIN